MQETLIQYFSRAVRHAPDRVIFRELDHEITYGECARRVAAAALKMRELRSRPNDRVVIYSDQTIPIAMMQLASALTEVLPIPVSPVFSEGYLSEVCHQSAASAVYTTPDHLGRLSDTSRKVFVFGLEHGYYPQAAGGSELGLDDGQWNLFDEMIPLDAAVEEFERAAAERQLHDPLLIQPTSGSTGSPKLVVRPYAGFSRYAQFVGDEISRLGIDGELRILAVNALTHAFACHMFTTALRLKATLCIPTDLDFAVPLADVRKLDPHVLPMTPRVLRSIGKQHRAKGGAADEDIFGSQASLLLSAGGKGDEEAFSLLRSQGVEVCEFYGSSEGSIIALTPLGGWKPGKAGKPVSDVNLRFADDGEVLVKSSGLFIGYFGNDEQTSLAMTDDGFYRTGDIGALDDDGYLRILGRKRDIFNTPEGSNIYPERIELLLESLPWVAEAMLVGDGQPFLTAHLVVEECPPGRGMIDEAEYPELYEECGEELELLNETLEHIERIVAFALYASNFSSLCYARLAAGKVRRDRKEFLRQHAVMIEKLYSRTLPRYSLHLVPPHERRFAERTRPSSAIRSAIRKPWAVE